MIAVLSLSGWAAIAQFVLALSGIAALIGAYAQVRIGRAAALRGRVYDYADTLNQLDMLRASARYEEKLPQTFVELKSLSEVEQAELMHLPNIIEEIAYLYNHGALDRDVAAELLGVYVERLWKTSESLVKEIRVAEQRPRVFIEWEQMQADTWKRRGVRGPLDVAATPPGEPKMVGSLSCLKWLFSAEYRRAIRPNR